MRKINYLICFFIVLLAIYIPGIKSQKFKVCRNITLSGASGNQTDLEEQIKKLLPCEIVEGHLRIHSLTFNSDTTFHNLLQITGHLLIQYVKGIVSLADIFPRLVVIRGQELLYNFGLILIGNRDLQEVGPWDFHSVMKGSVYVEDNIQMCVEPEIQWQRYTSAQYRQDNYFNNNHADCLFADCEEYKYCTVRNKTCHRTKCFAIKGKSCHKQCIGGCDQPNNATSCAACKNFLSGKKCVPKCPSQYYEYLDYRCITKEQCNRNQWKTFETFNGAIAVERLCVHECPEGKVGKCNGEKIQATCQGAIINRDNLGDHFRFCSVINGSLDIMVAGGKDVTKRLAENFKGITTITGYLSITAAHTLYSISFLSNLKVIEGNATKYKRCVFCVLENHNLETLWESKILEPKLKVNGKIYISFNQHLCPNEIAKFNESLNHENTEIESYSNGHNTQCNIFHSIITAVPDSIVGSVKLMWDNIFCGVRHTDIAGYFLYYRQTDKNITMFEDTDACSDSKNTWRKVTLDIPTTIDNADCLSHILTDLDPNKRYAVYARSYTVERSNIGIHTNLAYFKTSPNKPHVVKKISFENSTSEDIAISWYGESSDLFYEIEIEIEKDYSCDDSIEFDTVCSKCNARAKNEADLNSEVQESTTSSTEESKDDTNSCECSSDSNSYSKEYYERKKNDKQLIDEIERLNNKFRPKRSIPEVETKNACNNSSLQNTLCEKILVDWTNQELKMTPCLQTTTWTDQGSIFKKKIRTRHTSLILKSPFESNQEKSLRIKLKIRACIAEQDPCLALGLNVSCAICSDDISRSHYVVDKIVLPTFQIFAPSSKSELNSNIKCEFKSKQVTGGPLIHWVKSNGSISNLICGFKILNQKYHSLLPSEENCISIEEAEQKNYKIELLVQVDIARFQIFTPSKIIELDLLCNQVDEIGYIIYLLLGFFLLLFFSIIPMVYWKFSSMCKTPVRAITDNDYYGPSFMSDPLLRNINLDLIIQEKFLKVTDNRLGGGNFGDVYKGLLTKDGTVRTVACKTTNENDKSLENLKQEVENFQWLLKSEGSDDHNAFQSPFLLKLFGVCRLEGTSSSPNYYVVLEYMDETDLKTYLKQKHIIEEEIIKILIQVADAMASLSEKKIVHRDLAARNIMIDSNFCAKVGDFSLARYFEMEYYKLSETRKLPVRWTSPECLSTSKYNEKSDVWSYGVLTWEILTGCKTMPYPEVKDEVIVSKIKNNQISLSAPKGCSKFLKDSVMKKCLEFDPVKRLSFREITRVLYKEASDEIKDFFDPLSYVMTFAKKDFESIQSEELDEGCYPGSLHDMSQDDEDLSSRFLLSTPRNEENSLDDYDLNSSCISLACMMKGNNNSSNINK